MRHTLTIAAENVGTSAVTAFLAMPAITGSSIWTLHDLAIAGTAAGIAAVKEVAKLLGAAQKQTPTA